MSDRGQFYDGEFRPAGRSGGAAYGGRPATNPGRRAGGDPRAADTRTGRRRRRHGGRRVSPLLGTVVVVLLAGGGVAAARWLTAGAGDDRAHDPCAGRSKLSVVAAPEIVPVLTAAAEAVAPAAGGCPTIAVTGQRPVETVDRLATAPAADVWVPSSTLWLLLADKQRETYPRSGTVLARSPVVVATPRGLAEKLGWPAKQPGWVELSRLAYTRQIPRFSMADPRHDTSGLLAVIAVHAAARKTTADPGIAQLRALTLRSRLAEAAAEPQEMLTAMARAIDTEQATRDVGLFPVTEQALWAHGRTRHAVELVPIYPPDAPTEADYPMAVRREASADQVRRDLADRLAQWIRGPDGSQALTGAGLRPAGNGLDAADAAPSGPGFVAKHPASLPLPSEVDDVSTAAVNWAGYTRIAFQVLVLIDGSGSMLAPVRDRAGNTMTKAELLRRAAEPAVQLFGEEASIGLWVFAMNTPESPPYVEVLPIGPIEESVNGVPRRELLRSASQQFQPQENAGTPLFETILRADAEMHKRHRPGVASLVVVLTDGKDEDTKYAMSREDFLNRLRAGRDPARRLPIHCIGYGADADMATLGEVAQATGGVAAPSTDPADLASAIARLFLAARQTPG
jgi:hypothetical protein